MTSITRRAALGGMAAISATGAAGATYTQDPSLHALETLINRYVTAEQAMEAALNAVPEIERPPVGVQIGRVFMGRDADTMEDVYKPIMAYSEEAIDRAYEKELRAVLSIHGGSATRDAQIRQRYADRVAEKKAEIARQQAAVKLVEDEAGYTAAWDGVDTTAEALEALRVEIVNFVPDSLPAVVRKAAWCLEALADPDMNEMLRLLRSFASADPDQLRLGDATLT